MLCGGQFNSAFYRCIYLEFKDSNLGIGQPLSFGETLCSHSLFFGGGEVTGIELRGT